MNPNINIDTAVGYLRKRIINVLRLESDKFKICEPTIVRAQKQINDQLSNMIVPDSNGEKKDATDIQNAHSMYSNLIKDKISSVTIFMDDNYLPNKFTDTEVSNVLLSLFSVLNITKEDMKSTIEKISSEIYAQEGNDAFYLLKEACHEFFSRIKDP